MSNDMDKQKSISGFIFSQRELQICHRLIDAACEAGEVTGCTNLPPFYPSEQWYPIEKARKLTPYFDLYKLIYAGNTDAVGRLTKVDPDGFIESYNQYMKDDPRVDFTYDEVMHLSYRLKAGIKEYVAENKKPARKLYIADCHFFHNRLCAEMDRRGFPGYEEMNEHMIARWNEKVTSKDEVYILGDFSIAKGRATAEIIRRLNGKLYLIAGNHDRFLEDKDFDESMFRRIKDYAEIRDNGRLVILSHYPVFCYKGQYRQDENGRPLTYMLYGHVHDTHDERLVHRFIRETQAVKVMSKHVTEPSPIPCNMINCFCMFSNYQPMTLNEWIVIDRKRREKLDTELAVYNGVVAATIACPPSQT